MSSGALPDTGSCDGSSRHTKRRHSCAGCVPELLSSRNCQRSILSMTLATTSDYLVTGDRRHLLHLKKVQRTRILTARELTELLA